MPRAFWMLPVVLLTLSCARRDERGQEAKSLGDPIACAVDGATALTPVCRVERSETDGQLWLVVHHPDGGFRRFVVMHDGTGLAVADGAQTATTAWVNGMLDVRVGADIYRFPAHADVVKKPANPIPSG